MYINIPVCPFLEWPTSAAEVCSLERFERGWSGWVSGWFRGAESRLWRESRHDGPDRRRRSRQPCLCAIRTDAAPGAAPPAARPARRRAAPPRPRGSAALTGSATATTRAPRKTAVQDGPIPSIRTSGPTWAHAPEQTRRDGDGKDLSHPTPTKSDPPWQSSAMSLSYSSETVAANVLDCEFHVLEPPRERFLRRPEASPHAVPRLRAWGVTRKEAADTSVFGGIVMR